MLEAYASKLLTDDYAGMLETLGQQAQLDGLHFFCRQDSLIRTARLLANIPLSLQVHPVLVIILPSLCCSAPTVLVLST